MTCACPSALARCPASTLARTFSRITAPLSASPQAPRPSTGPHKLRECLPISLILRNRLKLALTRRETLMCVMRRTVKVDGKVRTDINFPAGFMDVVSIDKAGKHYRLLYDTKGRFVLHKVDAAEAGFKLCRVVRAARANKATIGSNPTMTGQASAIPYITTHDARTIRFADPAIKVNDTVKVNIATGKVVGHIKFETGNTVMCVRGHNIGRIGTIVNVERHPGGFDIVHVKDKRGQQFATRLGNIFLIGQGESSQVSLPAGAGVLLSIGEAREALLKRSNKPHNPAGKKSKKAGKAK